MTTVLVVHVVTRMNVGGVAALVGELVTALPASGIDVRLVCGDVQDGEREVDGLPDDLIRVPSLGRAPRALDDVTALRDLRRVLRDLGPDVVHTHTAKAGALGRLAAEGLGAARVHTFHGHLLQGYFGPVVTRAVTGTERALALRTDLLVSSGRRVGEQLRRAGVGRRRPWLHIPPGIRTPVTSGTREGRTVAFVGRLVPVKRLDRVLEVARLLPDVRFLVAGDGPLRQALEASAPPNVELLGWVADVGTVYGRADAVLLCSENEAMPLALLEGALCGLPGVSTDVGSAAEVVLDGTTGLLSAGSPRALADALERLLGDDGLRQRLGRAAQQAAEQHNTVEAMTEAHGRAYADLLR